MNTQIFYKIKIYNYLDYNPHNWVHKIPTRCGIIPFINDNNGIQLCMGIDRKSNEISDFGGGLKKSDLYDIDGAFREFKEESLNVFEKLYNNIDYNSSKVLVANIKSTTIYQKRMIIILLKYNNIDTNITIRDFNNFYNIISDLKSGKILYSDLKSYYNDKNYIYYKDSRYYDLFYRNSIPNNLEMSNIIWLSLEDINNYVKNDKCPYNNICMYNLVKIFLNSFKPLNEIIF